MAEGINKAILLGNVGADPELRFTQSGKGVLKLRLATTESYMDGTERKEVTHWHNVVIWGKRAEGLSKIVAKGSQIYIEGRIETRSYDDKDGVKRYVTEISVSNVILCGRRDGASSPATSPQRQSQRRDAPEPEIGGDVGGDDDIPF